MERQCSRLMMFTSSLLVSLLLLQIARIVVSVEASGGGLEPSSSQPCALKDPLMDPTYEELDGHYFVWQIPPSPRAILIIAPGGGMIPLSFFDPAPKCEQCYGMPEDRKVVLEALQRGYAVIVVKSIGEAYTVEWPLGDSGDLTVVTSVVKKWTKVHSLESLPMAVWAHSAGGRIATALTMTLPVSGLVLMNCLGMTEVERLATPSTFPPTFLVRMPRDQEGTVFNVSQNTWEVVEILGERGVEVCETNCLPKQLSPLYFTERIRCMNDEMSENVYSAFKASGWLDEDDYITKNPRAFDWEIEVSSRNALPPCVESGRVCLAREIEQELIAAYAEHSFTGDANAEVFPWLDSNMQSPIDPGVTWGLDDAL